MAGVFDSQEFVNKWIKKDVYNTIVDNLKGIKIEDKTAIKCGTILYNIGQTAFSFQIDYETNLNNRESKYLIGKVISKDIKESFKPIFRETYSTDGLLTKKVLGVINKHLENAKCELLKYPELYYDKLSDPNKELLVFEDITSEGFEPHNYATVLTFDDSALVLKEYAKLHAGSILVDKDEGLLNLYPDLGKPSLRGLESLCKIIDNSLKEMLDSNLELIEEVEGKYKNNWIEKIKSNPLKGMWDIYKSDDKFAVINHGNIGENLLYFRTNENKDLVSLCTFGGAKMGSLGVDLNNFLFICLDSEMRKEKKQLLEVYYNHFKYILEKGNIDPPFTLEQLEKEVDEKAISAIYALLFSLPAYVGGAGFENRIFWYNSEDMDKYLIAHKEMLENLFKCNPEFKRRFIEIFNDLAVLMPVEPNGIEPNGIEPNGIEPNGIEPNGIEPNGIEPNGIEPNGIEH